MLNCSNENLWISGLKFFKNAVLNVSNPISPSEQILGPIWLTGDYDANMH